MGVIQDMRLDDTHKGREAFSEVCIRDLEQASETVDAPYSRVRAREGRPDMWWRRMGTREGGCSSPHR